MKGGEFAEILGLGSSVLNLVCLVCQKQNGSVFTQNSIPLSLHHQIFPSANIAISSKSFSNYEKLVLPILYILFSFLSPCSFSLADERITILGFLFFCTPIVRQEVRVYESTSCGFPRY